MRRTVCSWQKVSLQGQLMAVKNEWGIGCPRLVRQGRQGQRSPSPSPDRPCLAELRQSLQLCTVPITEAQQFLFFVLLFYPSFAQKSFDLGASPARWLWLGHLSLLRRAAETKRQRNIRNMHNTATDIAQSLGAAARCGDSESGGSASYRGPPSSAHSSRHAALGLGSRAHHFRASTSGSTV